MSSDLKNTEVVSVEEVGTAVSKVRSLSEQDADVAMKYADVLDNFEADPKAEKKLCRKIDWLLLPAMMILASLQLIDKSANNYGSVMGLKTDLFGGNSNLYNWVGSIYYLFYLVAEYPASVILQKAPIGKALCTAIIIWGAVMGCHAACQGAATFLTCRAILGVFESIMNPSYVLLTAQWWTQKEHFLRSCIWWGSMGALAAFIGAGIGVGIYDRADSLPLAAWKYLYIIEGSLTVALGIIGFFYVPDTPANAWFLNEDEKTYCLARSKKNQQGYGNHRTKVYQLKEGFKDITLWCYFIYGMSYAIPNGGFSNFGSILLNDDFGFTTRQALLIPLAGGALDVISPVFFALVCKPLFKNSRLYAAIVCNLIVVIGMCLLNFCSNRGPKLAGYLSFYLAGAPSGCALSLLSSNVAGSTKKSLANSMWLIGYCAGNVIGPQTFRSNQAPDYVGAKIAMLLSFIVGTLDLGLLLWVFIRRNRAKDAQKIALGDTYVPPANIAFADLTDKENPEFRYSL